MKTVFIAIKSKRMCDYFYSIIHKSNSAKVANTFASIKECRKALVISRPDVLVIGPDLPGDKVDANWIDFCTKIRKEYPAMKILAIISHDEYIIFKGSLNSLTSGYISKDALPNVIISAIKAVTEGKFFGYDKVIGQVKKVEEKSVELKTLMQEMVNIMKNDGNHQEIIDKLLQITDECEKERMNHVKIMLETEKDILDDKSLNKYLKSVIDNMLISGHSNWDIADILKVSVDTVRLFRMELIQKLTGTNSVLYAINRNNQRVNLGPNELRLLRLVAAGYTSDEISTILYKSIETVSTNRADLMAKLNERNTITMVINALRTGMIKMEDLDLLESE